MPRKQGGIGRRPGKKRDEAKGTRDKVLARARDAAAASVGLSSPTPSSTASLAGTEQQQSRQTAVEGGVRYYREKLDEMTKKFNHENELKKQANARARASEEREVRAKELAEKRKKERDAACDSQRAWREELHDAEGEIEGLASERSVADLPVVGRERRGVGGGRGNKPWPLWMLHLILEMLIHGTPPAAIPNNILSQDRLTIGRTGQEVPSVTFCRDMRVVLRILTETLAAYQLALQRQWHQLFTDGTSRRQIALETVMMRWDDSTWGESPARLLPSKWNPRGVQGAGGWRFDL